MSNSKNNRPLPTQQPLNRPLPTQPPLNRPLPMQQQQQLLLLKPPSTLPQPPLLSQLKRALLKLPTWPT